jgi:hypothetical protein
LRVGLDELQARENASHVYEIFEKAYDHDESSAVKCRNFSIEQAENDGVARG